MEVEFNEAIYALPERVIKDEFERRIQTELKTIGQLSRKELHIMQVRVNMLVEIREDLLSIRQTKPSK